MKQYFLKAGAVAVLALTITDSFAQENARESTTVTTKRSNDDVIIIRPKITTDTKFTIEIKGIDIKINGKPIEEFKNDDISITRRKESSEGVITVNGRPTVTRFRGGPTVYGYGNSYGNDVTVNGYKMNTALLGVGTENTDDHQGVTITSVSKESAAAKAGLKEGDVITRINETPISSPGDLRKAVGKFNPDDKVTVVYKRDKKEQKVTAVLAKMKNDAFTLNAPEFKEFKNFNFNNDNNFSLNWAGKPHLGLQAQETEDGKGLKVLEVDDESAAEKAGLKEGDIITSFDGTEVNNIDKLQELSKPALEKGSFKVKLMRDGKSQEIEVKIPKNLKSTSL